MNEDQFLQRIKPKVLTWIEKAVGSVVGAPSPHDLASSHHAGSIADAQGPQFLKTDGTRPLTGNLAVSEGVQIDGVDVSAHAVSAIHHLNGFTQDDHSIYVHTGLARTIAAVHTFSPPSPLPPFALAANAQGQTVTGLKADQLSKSISAGNGLTGGGALTADRTLAVLLRAASGLAVDGTGLALGTPGSLDVATANAVTSGSHTHAVTGSSNPGAAAALLETTAAGGLTLESLAVNGAATVGQGLTAAANNVRVIHHTHGSAHAHLVVNPRAEWLLDEQFGVDIDDNLLVRGFIVGRHALQIKDAKMICHFDGSDPYETNFTGEATGHMGQVGVRTGAVTYRPGRFGKAVQLAEPASNYIQNPSFGGTFISNIAPTWTAYTNSAGSGTRALSTDAYVGTQAQRVTKTDGGTGRWGVYAAYTAGSQPYTGSIWFKVLSYSAGARVCAMVYHVASVTQVIGSKVLTDADVGVWQRLSATMTAAPDLTGRLYVFVDQANADVVFDAAQIENRSYTTPYCDGSLGPDHFWGAGGANNATSWRLESSLSYSLPDVRYDAMAVSCWIKTACTGVEFGGSLRIADFGSGGAHLVLYVSNTGVVGVYNDVAASPYLSSSTVLEKNRWYHICYSHGEIVAGVSTAKIFINGVEEGSRTWSALPAAGPSTLQLGRSYYAGNLNGYLDDFVWVGRPLTADEARAIYDSDAPIFAESSTWQFRSASNLVWVDSEGLWASDVDGNAAFAVSGVDGKSWGGATLDKGDILMGRASSYVKWDASAAQVTFSGEGAGITNINGANIQTGSVTADKITVTNLQAVKANTGTLTVDGTLTVTTGGKLVAGTTSNGIVLDNTQIKGVSGGVNQFYSNVSDGKLYAGAGNVVLDADGLRMVTGRLSSNGLRWVPAGGTTPTLGVYSWLDEFSPYTPINSISALGRLSMTGSEEITLTSDIIRFTGTLQTGAGVTASIYVPLNTAATSTSFDGDAFSTTAATDYTAATVFGASIPSGAKALYVRITARDSGSVNNSNVNVLMQAKGGTSSPVICRPSGLPNDYWAEATGIVGLDASGRYTLTLNASGTNTLDLIIQVHGYFI